MDECIAAGEVRGERETKMVNEKIIIIIIKRKYKRDNGLMEEFCGAH